MPRRRRREPRSRRDCRKVDCAPPSRRSSRMRMTSYLARFASLFLVLSIPVSPAAAASFIAPRAASVPGGVVTFKLPGALDEKPVVKYGDRPVLVARQAEGWIAVLGLGLSTEPGEYHVDVQQPGSNPRQIPFKVVD